LKHVEDWKIFEKKTTQYGGVRLLNEAADELRGTGWYHMEKKR